MKKTEQWKYAAAFILAAMAWINIAAYVSREDCFRIDSATLLERLQNVDNFDYDMAFANIKPLLPKTGSIGFHAGATRKDMPADLQISSQYYQSQYALAPLVLDYSANHDKVITLVGKSMSQTDFGSLTNSHQLMKANSYGILLWERK